MELMQNIMSLSYHNEVLTKPHMGEFIGPHYRSYRVNFKTAFLNNLLSDKDQVQTRLGNKRGNQGKDIK